MSNEIWIDRIFEPKGESTVMDLDGEDVIEERAFFEHPRYEDLGPISRGTFGDVRRVRDMQRGRSLAMKIMRRYIARESGPRARFAVEIEIMASLRHPGIVTIEDHGEFEDGRLWFTMPEIRGRTFSEVLDDLHAPNAGNVFQSIFFRQTLRSFAHFCLVADFAHENGIVHRDLKPKNMMIADDGATFVIDWGVAKRMTAALPAGLLNTASFTEPGEVLGTPAYMPPEQVFGDIAMQSPASDVYSLGAVLYHLLTGRPPYRGTRAAVIARIKRGAPLRIADVVETNHVPPKELVALCEAAMQLVPARRIPRALDIARGVLDWIDSFKSIDS